MKLFVGIDVSSQELEACFMNADGDKLETLTVKNNLNGASHLRDQIVAAADKLAVTEIHIGLEATSVYSWHPAMYLHQDPALRERKAKVFTLNPKLISKFREAYADMDKTDRLDAWVIADRLRFGRLTTTIVMQEQYVALQRLTRMRFHLVHNLAREKQYFLQNLFYKCNAFTTEVDSSVFGHALMEMLSEKFSLDDIAEMDVADLADYLRDKGRNRFPDPERVARCIQQAARASYRLSKVVEDSIDLVLGTSIESIRSIQKQLKDLDKAIERVLDGIQGAQCLLSVPGIGKVYAAGLLGELGDIERFKDQAAVAKYAGLTWRRHQSGVFEAEDTARIKSGNRFLRYYLVEAANSVRMRDEEFGEYYRKKYHEVPKNQHKHVLLRSGQLYTPRRKVNSAKD
ncbi:IS110 family transposase [Paenibacillus barengoltzii]|uniref:IS110 family transposase n=1 Tax=Paenibacillus barengoltzii TaxID=343517 RepID=UPI002DB7907E|nr:IS110 family transposase [Paenibacillus barengoltzii]MEC2346240.1 IS110 family transposase [Paenibacillus barengoltzii]